ncbi:unnamed protein product [Phytophthora fragariaefolia]|uniref:Unnamed protein product n=1 Tax=Phytophthora fragariaefolia TaxID=1490495 RepID=A0A9W7D849_9STRA|nr:unnamed protein product [Phytophthora fragariaefolia]
MVNSVRAIMEYAMPLVDDLLTDMETFLCRFIQASVGLGAAHYHVRREDFGPGGDLSTAKRSFTALQAKVADAPILQPFDRTKEVHVMLFADDWALNTTRELPPGPKRGVSVVFTIKTVLQPIDRAYYQRLYQVLDTGLNQYVQDTLRTVHPVCGHVVSVARRAHRVKEDDSAFAQLLHSAITNFMGLNETLQPIAPPPKPAPTVQMDPALLYARLPNDHQGFVLSFHGSAKTPKHGGYGSCAWILWRLPDWKIQIDGSVYLVSTTVNHAEYMGMNEGLRAAQAHGVTDLVVVVRFAETPDEDSEALPAEPSPPDQPNDAATEPTHGKNGEIPPRSTERTPCAEDVDSLEVQEERRHRVGRVHDEELRWANLKLVLMGESSNRMNGTVLSLVVPTMMVHEVLQSCHDSLEGGHQGIVRTFHGVKADYSWIGLYADVEKHAMSCPDCSSSMSRTQLRGYSPGNVLAEQPIQIVSMDFVIPLPKSRRGNTALLLFHCAFTGFGMAKAMSDTSALCVAPAFEECVYRKFGAPSLVRHDRDHRFTSEAFQAFAEMMQSWTRKIRSAVLGPWSDMTEITVLRARLSRPSLR